MNVFHTGRRRSPGAFVDVAQDAPLGRAARGQEPQQIRAAAARRRGARQPLCVGARARRQLRRRAH